MEHVPAGNLDLTRFVRAGDVVLWGQGCAEPQTLTEALVDQRHRIGRFRVFLVTSYSATLRPEQADTIEFHSLGGAGSIRRLARAGALDVIPMHLSYADGLIRRGALNFDVVLIQVRRAASGDVYSLGLSSDLVRSAVERARVVIAEDNDQVPETVCTEALTARDIDVLVETSRPPVTLPVPHVGESELRIGKQVAAYVEDGSTIQVGLGAAPSAVLASLRNHKGLGVHSGLVSDGIADLMRSGVVTNEHKGLDAGVTTTCLIMGTPDLYAFVHRNREVVMAPVSRTHGAATLVRLRRFVAINSALEVDLTGQVNAEAIDGEYVGLIGGQGDYMRAATASEGGAGIVVLNSTAGAASRIVARLSGPVTTPRSDVSLVVTEHGVADLRGATIRQRVQRMILVADPAHRDALDQEARRSFALGGVRSP